MFDRDVFSFDGELAVRELAREYASANHDYFGDRLRPAPIMLSEERSRLGCFTADPRCIALSRALVLEQPWGIVVEVLKHEMAHQFVAEVLGQVDETSHGPSFRRTCERLGIDQRASGMPDATPERSPVLERIRKLFALATSPNQHEAESAMRLAHRLMLKHNLEHPSTDEESTESFGFRHLGRYTGRVSEAERVLAGLLGEFFFVQPIWISVYRVQDHKRASVLEVTGRHDNLAMAEYVHGFLLRAAESLWREHKKQYGIERNVDRRAFTAGVMRGFAEKLRIERKSAESTGLVWVADPLATRYYRRRHPRVHSMSYSSSAHSTAGYEGRAAGRELVLSRPLGEGPSKKTRALPR